jgi:hypothetical protein
MTADTDDHIARLKAELRAELLAELKAKEAPPAPRVPPVPKWAGSGGENTGSSYCGPPSAPSGGGTSWMRRKRPDGSWFDEGANTWRYSSGEAIPATIEPRPLAADDQRLRHNVGLLDELIARDEDLSRR